MPTACPCKKRSCPRHGDCRACRVHHAASKRQCPVKCDRHLSIRPYKPGDEVAMSHLIRTTLRISNSKDYCEEYLEETIRFHSADYIAQQAQNAHFYVVTDRETIVACAGITGYWGSTSESYLLSVFVLPEYQGRGIGRKLMEALEADEYFRRAWRTEVGASLTAVDFYRKMGYTFKNGVTEPDSFQVVRMEKRDLSRGMAIDAAREQDAQKILALYQSVLGGEYCVWNELYPGMEEIETDTANGRLFWMLDGRTPAGAVSILTENEMDDFDCWRRPGRACEIARVVIAPAYQGRGLSKKLVEGAAARAKDRGYDVIHLSVAKGNTPAVQLYASMGFETVGEKDMYGNSYWLCEKAI